MMRARLSRTLLFPGPLAPLSHLGLTLLRHGVTAGLRYALYHLGLAPPAAPPVRLIRLRLYLDARPLAALLDGAPGGREVAAALLDPAGAGAPPAAAGALAGALRFHRLRLRWARTPRPGGAAAEGDPSALWETFRRQVTALARPWGEALLADLVAALDRRAARARGRAAPPCLSRQAGRLRAGRRGRLDLFGPPDLLAPSWAEVPGALDRALEGLAAGSPPPAHPLRGRFREAWRSGLDRLRPTFLALAAGAAERGLLAAPEDAFFIPFDLASYLAGDHRPSWFPDAVARNRREHREMLAAAEPADLQRGPLLTALPDEDAWLRAPLAPLP